MAEMKKDLESVLRRIRNLKTKMAAQNPEAFQGTKQDRVVLMFSFLLHYSISLKQCFNHGI